MTNDPRQKAYKDSDPAASLQRDFDRQTALEMRTKGATYREIAQRMGVAVSTAFDLVNDGWTRLNKDSDEMRTALRAIMDEQIDEMLAVSMPIATDPTLIYEKNIMGNILKEEDVINMLKAQTVALKLFQQKAKMHGLYAPVKIEHTGGKRTLEKLDDLRDRVTKARQNRLGIGTGGPN